ncbi:mucin-13-like isoform X2 [Heptranchias perlo]|uniref:mucin-13-like isoform X2 n=1 Tax=Heptranchias perlo TaxID=212740 RepID=UPI0035594A00
MFAVTFAHLVRMTILQGIIFGLLCNSAYGATTGAGMISPSDNPTPETTSPSGNTIPEMSSPSDNTTPEMTSPSDNTTPETNSPTGYTTSEMSAPSDNTTPEVTSPSEFATSNMTTIADPCHNTCKKKNTQCVQRDTAEGFVCECQPGYQDKKGDCESCPFGYGGIECKDGFELGIVVIGVIAGVLLLGMTIGLIFTCLRLKRIENDEQEELLTRSMEKEMRVQRSGKSGPPLKIPRANIFPDGSNQMMGSRPLPSDQPQSQSYYDEVDYSRQSNSNDGWKGWNEMNNFNNGFQNPAMEYEYDRKKHH